VARIGTPRPFYEALHPEIKRAVDDALDVLKRVGWKVREVDLPGLNVAGAEALPGIPLSGVWASIVGFEAMTFHRTHLEKTPQLYGREVYGRIAGGKVTMEAYDSARQELGRLRKAVDAVFNSVDILVTPTTPIPAGSIDAEPPIVSMRNTIPLSVYGLPTISIPCGFSSDELPIGLQITGPRRGDSIVFAAAARYEQLTNWHRRRPKISLLE
jgi:aspartyl-tRNA(Asn)/glutamyl-tRNA(Gln) amidotransferase subunit A